MKILVLGASSYVGARLYFDLSKKYEVVGTYSSNPLSKDFVHLDVTDEQEVKAVFSQLKPDLVVHAANNADPRWCEANPEEARALNEQSTRFIAEAAENNRATLVYISSYAAAKPINVYSSTKRNSEALIEKLCSNWVVIRPSLIIGYSPNTTNDRPFNRFLKNLDEGTPAEYDTSWTFQPTWIGHISEVIEACIEKNLTKQIILVGCPQTVSRFRVASDILSPFGVVVTPIDKQDKSVPFNEDLSSLEKLDLPRYSYSEIVTKIVREIKERENYRLLRI